jgi:hypothetical protein
MVAMGTLSLFSTIRKRKTGCPGWHKRLRHARIPYPLMMHGVPLHPDGDPPWRVNPGKVLLSGALVFPDQPLIRILRKTLDILHAVALFCIRKDLKVSQKLTLRKDPALRGTEAEEPPAGKPSVKWEGNASMKGPETAPDAPKSGESGSGWQCCGTPHKSGSWDIARVN